MVVVRFKPFLWIWYWRSVGQRICPAHNFVFSYLESLTKKQCLVFRLVSGDPGTTAQLMVMCWYIFLFYLSIAFNNKFSEAGWCNCKPWKLLTTFGDSPGLKVELEGDMSKYITSSVSFANSFALIYTQQLPLDQARSTFYLISSPVNCRLFCNDILSRKKQFHN